MLNSFKYFLINIFWCKMSQKNWTRKIVKRTISSILCVLNDYRYFGQNFPKSDKKTFNSIKFSCIIFCAKIFQYFYVVYDLCIKIYYSLKIGSVSVFRFLTGKCPPYSRIPRYKHQFFI